MSLILEALRKSEAERRRGQAPQLFDAPVAPAPAASVPTRPLGWWLAVPGIALLLALLWWRGTLSPTPTVPAEALGTGAAGVAGSTMPATCPEAPIAQVAAPSPGSTRSAQAVLPDPAQPAGPAVAAAPVEPVGTRATDDGGSDTQAPLPVRVDTLPPAQRTATVPAPPPMPAAPAPAPVASAVATPPASAVGVGDAVLRLADLSTAERSTLPPLRMSMHLWAPAPGDRFVILDGARVGEGGRVGAAVVDEITPDGAVLAWQGRRVKVPVR